MRPVCQRAFMSARRTRGERVALGTDMDGGFGPGDLPAGLDHPRKLDALADALRAAGWSDRDVEGFACANWLRLLSRALPAAEEK